MQPRGITVRDRKNNSDPNNIYASNNIAQIYRWQKIYTITIS